MDWSSLQFGKPTSGALHLVEELDTLHSGLDRARREGHSVALVPTMGNLHEGHLALVRRAGELADLVVATIFVNPFQFGPGEDFDSYPRTFERDMEQLAGAGCHVLFAPPGALVYPYGPDLITRVHVPRLGDIVDGESRPGFFRGVATVVNILFNMVQPDVALFGKKDYQQLLVIKRMVGDLKLRIRIEGVETVRESDGLAMSSRNGYLTPDERELAPAMHRALVHARDRLREGLQGGLRDGDPDFAALETEGAVALERAGLGADYFIVRRRGDLELPRADDTELVVLAAARLGSARLIDNVEV